jgi:hypothetical protein
MEYPNSGALFPAKLPKKHPKAPDVNGSISMERSTLRQLLNETDGDEIKIKIDGWTREGRTGKFLSLKYNDYKPQNQDAPKKSVDDLSDSDLPF